MPYPETREFANVGVVLLCHDRGYFGFKLLKRYGRVTRFFESMDRRIYLQGKHVLHEELTRFRSLLKSFELDLRRKGRQPVDTLRIFGELTRRREALFRFDQPQVLLADDPKAACEEVYGYFVERDFVTKEYQERQLERSVRRLLLGADLAEVFEERTIGDDEYHVRFPFVARQSAASTRVIKPLFLAQEEPNKIYSHGDTWIPKVRRLRTKAMLPDDVLFTIAAPSTLDHKRAHAAAEVVAELRSLGIQTVDAHSEFEILAFARGALSEQFESH